MMTTDVWVELPEQDVLARESMKQKEPHPSNRSVDERPFLRVRKTQIILSWSTSPKRRVMGTFCVQNPKKFNTFF
jgi:hypothetical protein